MSVNRPAAAIGDLTERECEVLALVAEGKTNAEIAAVLGIQFGTARNHVSAILAKLGVETREEAGRWWRRKSRTAPLQRWVKALLPLPALKLAAGGAAAALVVAAGVLGASAMLRGDSPGGTTVLVLSQAQPGGDAEAEALAHDWLAALGSCLEDRGIQTSSPEAATRGEAMTFTMAETSTAEAAYVACADSIAPLVREPVPIILSFVTTDEQTIDRSWPENGSPFIPATPRQYDILADGEVTLAERAGALDRFISCLVAADIDVSAAELDPATRSAGYPIRIPQNGFEQVREMGRCEASHWAPASFLWQIQSGPTRVERDAAEAGYFACLSEPLGVGPEGVAVFTGAPEVTVARRHECQRRFGEALGTTVIVP